LEAEIKETLAHTYVGVDPGRRVCSGMISLGEVVALDAAIWFSDLRGFTAISDDLEPGELIRQLNLYFDEVVAPIYGAGGEVLKYVGDAILAIFPASAYPDAGAACRAALDAVGNVGARMEALNRARQGPPLLHGVGLHFGQAQYGNIGSRERLDFTLIGREVNLTSRIEGLTKELDEPLLCSGAFVEASGMAARLCGSFALKGIAQPVEVFAPAR
jgi:adenylate cyclase